MSNIASNRMSEVVPVAPTELEASMISEPPADLRATLLATRLQALSADNRELQANVDGEKREKQRLVLALTRLQAENATLRQALDPAYAMSDEVGILSGKMEVLTQKVGAFDEHSRRLEGLLEDVRTALMGSAAARHALTQHPVRNEAAEQLHLILTSRSWRLMSPLRKLGRLLRGRR